MNKLLFVVSIALASNVAFSGNVNLRCTFPESVRGEARQFDFVINEQNNTVSYRVNGGQMFTENAFFNPEEVTWQDESRSVRTKRTINRTSLEFTQTIQIGEYPPKSESTKCTIIRPSTRRKF